MQDPLDEDPHFVDNWASLCMYSIQEGRLNEFKKKLSDHIYFTNSLAQKEYNKYIIKLRGAQEMSELDKNPVIQRVREKRLRDALESSK